ncbi:MAG: hypothetical protein ACR2L2_11235, partial [Acidobacteriota bacterium]
MGIADWRIEDCIDRLRIESAFGYAIASIRPPLPADGRFRGAPNPQYNPQFPNPKSSINSAIPNQQSKI